ncbi:MAG: hypothetical protein F6K09_18315 [Merismopedia sp. SIO2A8]|nr:hypothetical protein [Merismopedia sp. SIO2A8]
MAVEYNLVILGDSPVAYYAADYARSLNARVAIAIPPSRSTRGLYRETIILQTLQHLSQALHQQQLGPYNTGQLFHTAEAVKETGAQAPIQHPTSKIQHLKSTHFTQCH